jgi:HD superfamily phosphohydrolase
MYKHGIDERGSKWRHEDGSVRMFNQLLESNGIKIGKYGLDETDKLFIEEIIGGVDEKHRKGRGPEKFYLYDIVNNNRSGLDVDKLDYFERDMKMTAVTVKPFSADRFIESGYVMRAQPIADSGKNNQAYCRSPRGNGVSQEEYDTLPLMICYPEKLCEEAVEIFGVRYNMHKKVYTNKAVKKIEYMVRTFVGTMRTM